MVTEEFLEIAIESWSEWDLNPRPLNSAETLKLIELSGQNIYIRYIYIYIYRYMCSSEKVKNTKILQQ